MIEKWVIKIKKSEVKKIEKLPRRIKDQLILLLSQMKLLGPLRRERNNFGRLQGQNVFHCHLNKGRPTFVLCWVFDNDFKTIEVIYVGTHEKAPY